MGKPGNTDGISWALQLSYTGSLTTGAQRAQCREIEMAPQVSNQAWKGSTETELVSSAGLQCSTHLITLMSA